MAFFTPDPTVVSEAYERADRFMDQQQTIIELLQQAAVESGDGLQTLAITEDEVRGGIEEDFPVEGARRWMIPRLATGGSFTVPLTLVKLLDSNNRRLGGTIVNKGANNISLILAPPLTAGSQLGLGEVWLRALGGSWDFRVGSLLWCGSVCARAEGGESTVTIAEV
jgi:hypothetical protein